MEKLLLVCDLDRTVLPNGKEPLDPAAPKLFREFTSRPHVTLAYASGRDIGLIRAALEEYDIPTPDIAVGDVGTSMHFFENGAFRHHQGWDDEIAPDWNGLTGPQIYQLLLDLPELTPQEPEKQNTFKQSYYTDANIDKTTLVQNVTQILTEKGIKPAVIFSIDEQAHKGLLDILPASATKKHATQYLHRHFNLDHSQIVYAGDSGNDIDPLTSGYQAILVGNARQEIKDEVTQICTAKNILPSLFIATQNYSAGILEGLTHFQKR